MPIFDYECPCGTVYEDLEGMVKANASHCPKCGNTDVKKLLTRSRYALNPVLTGDPLEYPTSQEAHEEKKAVIAHRNHIEGLIASGARDRGEISIDYKGPEWSRPRNR
jgi:putative FmdB family regulatory protein